MSGTPSFMISEGWMRIPTLSQRVAPLTVTPKKCVASKRRQPARKIGSETFFRRRIGIIAKRSITVPATRMLRNWSSMRHGKL